MPKPSDDIQDLKRRLSLLDRLDGRAVACADGVFVIAPGRVRDPRPLVAACAAGRPTSAAIRAALSASAQPLAIAPALLAAAQRDLHVIEAAAPAVRELTRAAPRIFRRFSAIDDAWIAGKRARLARLAELLRELEAPALAGDHREPAWFERVLDLVGLVHGEDAPAAVRAAMRRLVDGARTRRADARRALHEVLAGLEGEREPTSQPARAAFVALREATRLPGRSRAKRVAAALRALFGFSAAAEAHVDPARSLADQVRAAGERWIAAIESPRSPAFRERAHRFFAHYALAFDPRPRWDPLPEHVDLGLEKLRFAIDSYGGRALALGDVIGLCSLDLGHHVDAAARLVEAGLPLRKLGEMVRLGQLEALVALAGDSEAASAYADWALTLVPHYASLGLEVPLTPATFAALRRTRKEDLAVLAVCLMKNHSRAEPEGAEQALARLDATLGLFRRRPAEASSILADLSGTTPGAGRAAFPDFAAWLGDDALLDRHVHLARLAGQPAALSRNLTADFHRQGRLDREAAHLAALTQRTPAQEARLARLASGAVERPDAAWTQRRLAERVRALSALAYDVRLDAVLRGIVKEVWGISLAQLTPGWRDAIRFYLAVDDNRELLGTVLRAAASGVDLARTLPRNRAWIDEVADHFDVEAWLAPRARDVRLGAAGYRLAVERDPVEVLRMGIPFGTCLALETGCNAASTVINAADANKRVLYLRDAAGRIVARKLLAVSERHTLLGYRLYVAASEHHEAIDAAFHAMCVEIAESARLPLAADGKPKQIHPGFWYDDGTVPFGADRADAPVEAYCRSIGLPVPAVVDPSLGREAAAFGALESGDPARVIAALRDAWHDSDPASRAAAWLLDRVGPDELIALARRSNVMTTVALERAAARGAIEMLELAGRIADWSASEQAAQLLERFPRTAEIAAALVAAAQATKRNAAAFEDGNLEHQTMYLLPAYAAEIPTAAALALCDRVEPLWDWVVQQSEQRCLDCKQDAERWIIDAVVLGYARARDPESVIRYLESPRSSALARRAALRIAARYALAEDGARPSLPPPRREPVRPSPPALRALARLRQRAPELAGEPDLLAALLRQSAGAPLRAALPVPSARPFEALGDLLAQLDLAGLLAPWLGVDGDAWEPSPWELYVHRRRATARRAALTAEAARSAPHPSRASDQLAWLGDTRALAALLQARPPERWPPAPEPPATLAPLPRAQEIARHIAAQIAAADRSAPLALSLECVRRPHERLGGPARGVDPGLDLAAFTTIERALEGAPVDPSELTIAYGVILLGGASTGALRVIVERLVARPALADADRDFIGAYLEHRTSGFDQLPPELVVSIARHAALRAPLFTALARLTDHTFGRPFAAVHAAAFRAGDEALADVIFEGWIRALLALASHDPIGDIADPALYRRAVRLALDAAPPAGALAVYQASSSPARAAVFLDELGRHPTRDTPAMRAAVADLRKWGSADPSHAAAHAWLRVRLKSRDPG